MILLVLTGAGLSVPLAVLKSATFDEPINLMHGIQARAARDFTAPVDYPPLTRWMAAAAVDASGTPLDYRPGAMPWTPGILPHAAQRILYLENDADRLIFWGRMAFVPLHVLLAVAVYCWSLRCWGRRGALVSLALCAFSPSILAHGSLIASDVPVTVWIFVAHSYLYRFSGRAALLPAIASGAFLGLALLSKYSALFCVPVFFLLSVAIRPLLREPWIVHITRFSPTVTATGKRKVLVGLAGFTVASFAALLVVWAFYGFRYASFAEDDTLRSEKATLLEAFRTEKRLESASQERLLEAVESTRVLPEPYLLGIRHTWKHMERRLSYFMGERSIEGSFWYFPVAFALKTPVGALLLFAFAAYGLLARRIVLRARTLVFLLGFPSLYLAYAVLSHINLGERYIFPAYPFLFVLGGGSGYLASSSSRLKRIAFWGALAWFVASSLAVYPDSLAYFNELSGGPRGGIRYLGDSNLDWGQDLKQLRPWMEEHGVRHVKLGYFGTALPQYYGISFDWLPSVGFMNDRAGTTVVQEGDILAVSATCLQGFYFDDMRTYRFLDDFVPIGHLGHSIYIYRIVPERLRRNSSG